MSRALFFLLQVPSFLVTSRRSGWRRFKLSAWRVVVVVVVIVFFIVLSIGTRFSNCLRFLFVPSDDGLADREFPCFSSVFKHGIFFNLCTTMVVSRQESIVIFPLLCLLFLTLFLSSKNQNRPSICFRSWVRSCPVSSILWLGHWGCELIPYNICRNQDISVVTKMNLSFFWKSCGTSTFGLF